MSSLDNIEPPVIKKYIGSKHPINQTKEFLLRLLFEIGFKENHAQYQEISSCKTNA